MHINVIHCGRKAQENLCVSILLFVSLALSLSLSSFFLFHFVFASCYSWIELNRPNQCVYYIFRICRMESIAYDRKWAIEYIQIWIHIIKCRWSSLSLHSTRFPLTHSTILSIRLPPHPSHIYVHMPYLCLFVCIRCVRFGIIVSLAQGQFQASQTIYFWERTLFRSHFI